MTVLPLVVAMLAPTVPSPAPPKAMPTPAPPPAIEGTVRGPGGGPVKGALVAVRRREAERSWSLPDPPLLARTDGEGRFRVVIGTLGAAEVRIQAEGLAPRVLGGVRAGERLNVQLEKGRVLEGLVRDASSGKPVGGASVQASPPGPPRSALEAASDVRKTSTDAQGRFRMDGLGAAPVNVTVTSPGYASDSRRARAGTRLDVLLLRGVSILGSVRDARGAPIAGAIVQAEADLVRDPQPATTDAQGRFAIAGVDDRPYRVWARSTGGETSLMEDVTVEADEDAHVDLVIPRSSEVMGRILSPGPKPVAGTVVLAELDGRPSRVLPTLVRSAAGADGRFRISGLPPGSHALAVSAPGFAPKRLEVGVTGHEPLNLGDVELERGLVIRGRVQDAASLPIAGARIRGFFPRSGPSVLETLSDSDGSFTLAGLEEGTCTLMVSSAGYGEAQRQVATGSEGVKITLQAGGTISGQVVDPKGEPVETFSVAARTTDREQEMVISKPPTTVEDPNGRFTIDDLPEGTFLVEVFAQGKRPGLATGVAVRPGTAASVGRIRLEAGGVVRGVVVDSRGSPIASARVTTQGPGRSSTYRSDPDAQTDLDGGFELQGTVLGPVDVVASHPDFATGKATGVVVEQEVPTTARVVLTAGGRIEGHARRRDGSGIPDAYVYVQSIGMGPLAFRDFVAVSPGDGSFLAERVPPGRTGVDLMTRSGDAFSNRGVKHLEVVEGETLQVEFAAREILVMGRVTRSGEPLPGARVTAGGGRTFQHHTGSLGAQLADGPIPGMGVTRPDGSYALIVHEPGRTWFSVESLDGHRKYLERRMDVPDGDSFALDLAIAGTTVAGVVVDKESRGPLQPASVIAFPEAPGSGLPLRTDTGPDGRFEMNVPPGKSRIEASAPGHAKQSLDIAVGPSGVPDLTLALPRGGTIEGKVVDSAGRPVPGLPISAIAGEGPDSESTHGYPTLSDGTFLVERLADKPYTLFAGSELSGFGLAPQVPAGASGVLLALQPGGRVLTSVRDADGKAVAGASVSVDHIGGFVVSSPFLRCTTSAEGRCEMAVPQGSLRLLVGRPGAHASVTVDVPPQGLGEAQVTLPSSP